VLQSVLSLSLIFNFFSY